MSMNETNDPRDEELLEHEEDAAAAEAAAIGVEAPEYDGDEAERAVEEGGGGVAEGFEESEEELIEAASHGEQRHNPAEDAFTPEAESDESTAAYGEADELETTEGPEDTYANEDDD
jgi:hypothetical protein